MQRVEKGKEERYMKSEEFSDIVEKKMERKNKNDGSLQ